MSVCICMQRGREKINVFYKGLKDTKLLSMPKVLEQKGKVKRHTFTVSHSVLPGFWSFWTANRSCNVPYKTHELDLSETITVGPYDFSQL